MKAITTFASSALLLAAAGQASAAPVSVQGALTAISATSAYATVLTLTPTSPGLTGTFDPVTGAFSFALDDYDTNVNVAGGTYIADISVTDPTLAGTADGTDNVVAGNSSFTCTDNAGGLVCGGASAPPISFTATFVDNAGVFTLTAINTGANATNTSTYEFSAVPLPAAAWLFGSGLLGLAGMARRKRLAA